MTTWNPLEVSCSWTLSASPEFMNRSLVASGVKVARVEFTGLAGACDTPLLVMNAKFTYSIPVTAAQALFSCFPVFMFWERLSMFSAAHHSFAEQLLPAGHVAHPG